MNTIQIGSYHYETSSVLKALGAIESGRMTASDSGNLGVVLALAVHLNRNKCIQLLLDQVGVPETVLSLKERISIYQLTGVAYAISG